MISIILWLCAFIRNSQHETRHSIETRHICVGQTFLRQTISRSKRTAFFHGSYGYPFAFGRAFRNALQLLGIHSTQQRQRIQRKYDVEAFRFPPQVAYESRSFQRLANTLEDELA